LLPKDENDERNDQDTGYQQKDQICKQGS